MARNRPPASKFGRYRFSVSVQVPEPAELAAEDAQDEQLVGSGSFSVDTAWMTEKLRKHQLGDPNDFLAPMLRSGVASGATKISLDRLPGGLGLHFDGRPFGVRELSDPLHALIDRRDASTVRNLHFAYGLLALERLGPEMVLVASGGPAGQSSAVLSGKGTGPDNIGINRAEGTSMVVRWGKGVSWWRTRDVFKRVSERYGLTSAALFVEGRQVQGPPPDKESGWHSFEERGWRGAFRFREEEDPKSRVRLYCLGAFVQDVQERLDSRQVDAFLGGDGLTLDISQSGVVRDWEIGGSDSSLEAGLEVLSAEARRYY